MYLINSTRRDRRHLWNTMTNSVMSIFLLLAVGSFHGVPVQGAEENSSEVVAIYVPGVLQNTDGASDFTEEVMKPLHTALTSAFKPSKQWPERYCLQLS